MSQARIDTLVSELTAYAQEAGADVAVSSAAATWSSTWLYERIALRVLAVVFEVWRGALAIHLSGGGRCRAGTGC